MKIVAINTVNYGSTGRIMIDTLSLAQKNGYDVYAACKKNSFRADIDTPNPILVNFSNKFYSMDSVLQYATGYLDCFSHISTRKFLKTLDEIKPDIIHIHNIHDRFINLKMLFAWIKKHNIKVIWTLHDCWTFTGQCVHFSVEQCYKWKNKCHNCSQYKHYPSSRCDRTKYLYQLKKKCFTGIQDMTIVTPSRWLADLVKQSFLKDYHVRVIYNGIDFQTFHPTESMLRVKLNLQKKTILLGCAAPFSQKKGLDVFLKLSQTLSDTYAIVLVGLTKQQIAELPQNIIGIERTSNQHELAQFYTIADIFVNPTREEVLGMVNIEALACGTPVVTFASGGSPETIDETCGISVEQDNIDALIEAIHQIEKGNYTKENCIKRASLFDMNETYREYIELYNEGTHERKSNQ